MMSGFLKCARLGVIAVVFVGNAVSAQTEPNQAIWEAIRNDDLVTVKQAVTQGADINYNGGRPLIIAASGSLGIVKYLVSAGANVNGVVTYRKRSSTALGAAAARENYAVVDYLLSMGADPSVVGKRNKYPPLMVAVMTRHLDQVKKVVDRGGVDLDYREPARGSGLSGGKTALMIAAERGFGPIVEYLIDQGANVNQSNDCGETALFFAAWRDFAPIVKYLLGKGAEVKPKPVTICSSTGNSPLKVATDEEVIRLLREAGAVYHPYEPYTRGPYK